MSAAEHPAGESERGVRIGYATNAFPGESVAELTEAVAGPLSRVSRSLSLGNPLGLEMRLSATAADELGGSRDALARLKAALSAGGLEVIALNGFSPSDFHSRRVKEDAYRPTWLEEGRAQYTRRVASIFADMLAEGATGSLSTSPGSFKTFGDGPALLPALGEVYAEMAGSLAALEERMGRRILLSIEPEPGCTIETTQELIEFFENHLLVSGRRRLSALRRVSRAEAERLLRRHIAVTFDTAHLAVEFEDLIESVERIAAAGIRIGKVHATSAVRLPGIGRNPDQLAGLSRFLRSPYMHQTIGLGTDGCICLRSADLAGLLRDPDRMTKCEEVRIHFHLPLYLDRLDAMETTASESIATVRHILARELCDTVVLETYTWKVLELFPGLAESGIEAAVAEELRWAHDKLFNGGGASSKALETRRGRGSC